jgi:histidinol-phosphate/aromatic aminotransferase/cobyric acid decarboxylase-like protein
MRRGSPVLSMSMPNTERETAASPARSADARSPFVRLAELLGDLKPGKPVINLSVGEPQHSIPSFVGPVLAAHLPRFNRYPLGKGTEPFRRAAVDWLGRRYRLKRPLDPENEIIVLSGTREGLFLAAIAAKRWVGERAGTPAILIPNPFYVPYAAAAEAAGCEPVYLAATAANAFMPDLDRLDEALCARTVAMYLASPSNPQGAVADLGYLTRLAALARRHGFLVFTDECYSEIYTRQAPHGMLEAAGPDFANVTVFHSLSKRSSLPGLRVGFAAGDRRFIAKFLDLRNCRSRPRRSRSLPTATKHMSRKTGGSTRRSSISPTRSSVTATAIAGPPALFFSGSTLRATAAASRRRCGCGARRDCACCPAATSRATFPTAAIPAPTTFASRWCRTRKRRPKRCIALSRCSGESAAHHAPPVPPHRLLA